jgi:ubiquinol-cytochrome c reductase cytochrome b subunit
MLYKIMLWLFVIDFFMLGFLGTQATTEIYTLMAQIGTIYYFAFFLLMPIYSKLDRTKPVPERVTE